MNLNFSLRPANVNILIVNDTLANLTLLSKIFKDRGYQTRPVPNGRLVLQAAQNEPPDLILLDITMPEMKDDEVCRHLKADSHLREISPFISALTDVDEKVKAFEVGGVDDITKPFQFEEVTACIEAHLKLRILQQNIGLI